MCGDCWREATLRHANGMGEGESVTEVYRELIHGYWCLTPEGKRVVRARAREREATDRGETT